jgi:hypothetical protein
MTGRPQPATSWPGKGKPRRPHGEPRTVARVFHGRDMAREAGPSCHDGPSPRQGGLSGTEDAVAFIKAGQETPGSIELRREDHRPGGRAVPVHRTWPAR